MNLNDGMRIAVGPDAYPQGFTRSELNEIMYQLNATSEDSALMTERESFAVMDAAWNPGEPLGGMILDAVTTKYNRFPRTMAALARVLKKHMATITDEVTVEEPEIGEPKKSGAFATVSVMFPFSDGQSVTVVFHAPEGDPKKVMPTDTLIAFRWLLNKRDITQVVSAEQAFGPQKYGVTKVTDISLDSVGKRITQLVAENSAKFLAAQAKVAASKAELEAAVAQIEALEQQENSTTDELAGLATELETQENLITSTTQRIEDLKQRNSDLEQQISDLRKIQEESGVDLDFIVDRLNEMGLDAGIAAQDSSVIIVGGDLSKDYALNGQAGKDGSVEIDILLHRVIDKQIVKSDLDADAIVALFAEIIAEYKGKEQTGSEESGSTSSYNPNSDPRYKQLTGEIRSSLKMISDIDNGVERARGFNRSLFVSSITGKINRLGKDESNRDLVYAALDYIRDTQKDWKKPAITARNGIWKLFDYDKRPAPGTETEGTDTSTETVADRHYYGLRARPATFASVPEGPYTVTSTKDALADPVISQVMNGHPEVAYRHGVISYERELTAKEISDFELWDFSVHSTLRTEDDRTQALSQLTSIMVDDYIEQGKTFDEFFKEIAMAKGTNHPFYDPSKGAPDFGLMAQALRSEYGADEKADPKALLQQSWDEMYKAWGPGDKGETTVETGTPEAVTTLQDIVAGKYDSTPSDDVQDMLEKCLEELETLGIAEQHDDLLGKAAEKYVELMDKEGL